jgi:hypothetical protein
MDRHALAEPLGRVAGLALAPWTAAASALRRGRTFHPAGVVVRGEVEAIARGPWARLGRALEGHALVRLSAALFRGRSWPDVLGCAVRFTRTRPVDAGAREGDQDLLTATIRRPWTMAFSPFTTDRTDHLANDFFGVSPFRVDEGVVEWRLRPERPSPPGADRVRRLEAAMAAGAAHLVVGVRRWPGVLVVGDTPPFEPVARIRLVEPIDVDQDALRFDPFRTGRGVVPTGFVHGLRKAAYAASQRARPRGAASP